MGNFLSNLLMAESLLSRNIIQPLLSFSFRFYIAYEFFKFGLNKVNDSYQVTQETKDMFSNVFDVPFLSSDVAAYLTTYAELILPILLVIGLFTRPAALALFILNAVAAFTLAKTELWTQQGMWLHILWGVILIVIFSYGPNKISMDSWLSDMSKHRESNLLLKLILTIILSIIGYFLLNKFL